jgi:hypothetical protein
VPLDLGLSNPADLGPRHPQQCVLVTDIGFLRAEQNLWLDNLYMIFSTTDRTRQTSLVECVGLTCNLWLSSVTMQGDQVGLWNNVGDAIGAVAVVGGQLYAEGVCFIFGGRTAGFCSIEFSNRFMEFWWTLCVTEADRFSYDCHHLIFSFPL